jgi:hypothetical protein
MSWRAQLNAVKSNVAGFAQRVKNELTAEFDLSTELQVGFLDTLYVITQQLFRLLYNLTARS